ALSTGDVRTNIPEARQDNLRWLPDSRARSERIQSGRNRGRDSQRDARSKPFRVPVAATALRVRAGEAAVRHPGRLSGTPPADRSRVAAAHDLLQLGGRARGVFENTGSFSAVLKETHMDKTSRQELVARYKDGYRVVAEALQGATDTELDARPAPGKWSAR